MATDLLNRMFDKMDKDGDGSISQKELEKVFKDFDTNDDGSVSQGEFVEAFEKEFSCSAEVSGRLFKGLDKDGDGNITIDEVNALFVKMDSDGNGSISKEEFSATFSELMS